jgi:hypothetical protein
MISIKIHNSYRSVVAICDSELIGKEFVEDKKLLDLRENFYKERELPKGEIVKIIKAQMMEDATFNIIGKESMGAAKEAGLIDNEETLTIQGIPYILAFL